MIRIGLGVVVGHEKMVVSPNAVSRCQIGVMFDLGQNRITLFRRSNGNSPNTKVYPSRTIQALGCIHQAEIIVGTHGLHLVDRADSLVGRDVVVVTAFDIPVIVGAFAHEQHIFQMAATAEIHHPDKVAHCRGILDAGAELVVDLLDIGKHTVHVVTLTMELGQGLRLTPEQAWRDDQQLRIGNAMEVLVGNEAA